MVGMHDECPECGCDKDEFERETRTGMNTPDTDDLNIGDQFRLVTETILTVVGVAPAFEAPESADEGALYEVRPIEPGGSESERSTTLYRPYHFERALAAGAVYLGKTNVEGLTEPFWCDSCERPIRGHEQLDGKPIRSQKRGGEYLGVTVCSYNCRSDLVAEQRQKRWQADY